jgi:CheY-like chemotaxis protein
MNPKAAEKGLGLVFFTMPDVPRYVKGDHGRVKQILTNLVNNAIKFTPGGYISTRVALVEKSSEHAIVRFEITDTGIGIAPDKMSRLFKSFSQVDSSTTRIYGGTGLGLAISKQLAELMGGAIGVESALGSGSTFWFSIRFGPAFEVASMNTTSAVAWCSPQMVSRDASITKPEVKVSQPASVATDIVPAPLAKPSRGSGDVVMCGNPDLTGQSTEAAHQTRILLAEDNRINQIVAAGVLANHGYPCDIVDDGKKAVEAVATGIYDLVLMDCMMPEMDGLESMHCIREAERAQPAEHRRRTHIIALTASAITGDRERCIKAGADDYVSKPLNPDVLIKAIRRLLNTSNSPNDQKPTLAA